jgi:hypothetical protein
MSTPKPTFKTIDFGLVEAADKFAKENNVPEMIFPDAPGQGSSPVSPFPTVATSQQQPSRQRKAKPIVEPTSVSTIKRLAVELPEYLVKAIGDKAHATDTTNRYVVTQALQKAGFYVAPEDLREDGRRVR